MYVGDGFGAVHRKHASVYDLPARLPHAAGYLIATEVGVLKKLTEDVKRPYVVVLGGAKVSDKLGVIDQLLGKADRILIGGGMAYTFLKAQGHEVGISLLQEDQIPTVIEYLERAEKNGVEFVLPVDVLVSDEFPDLKTKAPADFITVDADAIPADKEGLDIGPKTARAVRLEARRRRDRLLERPDGRLRAPRLRRGHQGRRPGAARQQRASPSSAAATRPPPCACSVSTRTHSATFRPAAAPASNTSRARRSPASPHWRTEHRE